MTARLRQLWPLFLIVILLSVLPCAQAWGTPDTKGPDVVTGEQAALKDDIPTGDEVPGAAAVFEARAVLSKLKPYPTRISQYSKPVGFAGTSVYYAKHLFALLFMNGPPTADSTGSILYTRKLKEPLLGAVNQLEDAAAMENPDALFILAEVNFYGQYGHPRNYTKAFDNYYALASTHDNATAQSMLGFMYATGIGGVVDKDQARALLYHTFAANGGNTQSQMTAAFRHHHGVATPRSCDKASHYYKTVADKAIQYLHAGPPGGTQLRKEAYRLADEHGGAYGEGASVSSSGINAKHGGPTTDAHAAFDDVLEYLDLMSRKGELKATFGLGRLHYEGSRALKQDYSVARDFFLEVARRYWTKDGKIRSDPEPGLDKLASKAAGYLGRMFLRAEGSEQNFTKAKVWFKRGIENGDALCQYSMGLMSLYGLGQPADPVKAAQFFGAAADQGFNPAQVRLGALLLDQGDLAIANKYFGLAADEGHLEAFYYLAEGAYQGVGRDKSCNTATHFYKIVAEKAEPLHSKFKEANEAYEAGDLETAMVHYMMAAEQGYEIAQANVAYLLDQRGTQSPLSQFLPFVRRQASILSDAALALIYWTRSAKQLNIDSMVKMGDYYLAGLGTVADSEKAAACYQAAAETLQSAQAMWNLGWMHENGVGIEQDFHLAKRFYDQSLETNEEAYLPVTLALMKLRIRSAWNTFTRGKINPIHDEPSKRKRYSFSEWFNNFLEADMAQHMGEDGDEWDTASPMPGGDDLYDEIDESIIDTLIILGLAAALAALVYWRQQQRRPGEQRNRDGDQQQQGHGHGQGAAVAQQDQDRGRFPPPGDPALQDWAVGGVGH